ncbi:hypothetical protein CathTA2_2438 [Caldalkalibacillus thermarum TA2.A1]|uniref:Uncharacterized protein n=1 Tax=Caldalkalibacillus thermarum (strain TA2.A1) TaxID=986075 RepID=F5L9D3_CALTT|nr:hypothetical protein [Caldalkalibacillus thermarum]EGL82075.1 hypothetical protein CathTA2_2438 [Caldalkalibacillus thermarum TA2.A1]QZT34008.1 hypothetical protein HUR95_00785 [Caldalkalibacillus thermarum TA2.A1]
MQALERLINTVEVIHDMQLRRLVLIDKLQAAGADRETDKLLCQLSDDELNRLATRYGLEEYMIDRVRVG